MFTVMAFMFLFFIGFIAMFFYLIWRMDQNTRALRDEHAQLRVLLRAMESRLDHLENAENRSDGEEQRPENDGVSEDAPAGHDPLLHLSFERSPEISPAHDPNLDLNLDDGIRRG